MKFLLIFLLCLCAYAAPVLQSPKASDQQPRSVIAPPVVWTLGWQWHEDADNPARNVVFNMYGTTNYWSTNVSPVFTPESIEAFPDDTNRWVFVGMMTNVIECWRGWTLLGTTSNRMFRVYPTNHFGFWMVKATNVVTGVESQ